MFTAIISAIAAIAAASISAFVTMFATLRSKKLELFANSEERKSASLQQGYDTMLAAADFCWHYRCHDVLRQNDISCPFDWDDEFPNLRHRITALFSQATDLLKANSLHYEQVAPALLNLYQVTVEARTASMLEPEPKDYEESRQLVIEMSRIDARLTKPVKRGFWKRFSKNNQPQAMQDLSAEDRLRRAGVLMQNKEVEGFVDQGENAIQAFIEMLHKRPKVFAESLSLTASRISHWAGNGIIDKSTPCDSLEEPCYKEAAKWLHDQERAADDE